LNPVLEIIVTSLEDALAAEAGGATRLELVRDLAQDGLTPPLELVSAVIQAVRIPVRVMLRENNDASFAAGDVHALDRLRNDARALSTLPIDGIVTGFLRGSDKIDTFAVAAVSECVPGKPVTFHRAFENIPDSQRAMDALAWFPQVDTLLVSGAPGPLPERIARLNLLQLQKRSDVRVLAGGGLTLESAAAIKACTGINAFHFGRAARHDGDLDAPIDPQRVAELREILFYTPPNA
jgi:copper homeostasis protein